VLVTQDPNLQSRSCDLRGLFKLFVGAAVRLTSRQRAKADAIRDKLEKISKDPAVSSSDSTGDENVARADVAPLMFIRLQE
jgi:hypothetical protein